MNSGELDELWVRWRRGEPIRVIGRALGTHPRNVRAVLVATGGVRPAPRRRSARHLSAVEREEVSRGLSAGHSARQIAAGLGRSASTVTREIARNGGREHYRAQAADAAAWGRALRPKAARMSADAELATWVRHHLWLDWSPEQIAAAWRRQHPGDRGRWLSHESIYRSIYLGAARELGKGCSRHLRSGRSVRRPRVARKTGQGRGRLRNMVSIRDRPKTIGERVEVGHWEGDLVMGSRPSAVATLVERVTRYVRVVPLPDGYKADAVRRALVDGMAQLPPHLRRSLTWDRGREMAQHEQLAAELGLDVYFCNPSSPWQRGSIENTNRLLRQYLPKNADLRTLTIEDLERIAERINTRPRRVLDWATAEGVLAEHHLQPAP